MGRDWPPFAEHNELAEGIKVIREKGGKLEMTSSELIGIPYQGKVNPPPKGITVQSGDGPVKITETVERLCCGPQDLKRVIGCEMVLNRYPRFKFCQHCGRRFVYSRYTDAAGDSDYDWFPEEVSK